MAVQDWGTRATLDHPDQSFDDWYEKNVARFRNAAGVRRHLNDRYGKGEWGNTEFDQYMLAIYERAREDAQAELRAGQRRELPSARPGATREERIQAYLDYFEDVSPNDRMMIETMVTLEIAIEESNENLQRAITGDDRPAAKSWGESIRGMSREHRQIQETLGIQRATRDERDRSADQAEYVRDIIQRSATFVKEQCIQINCPHCLSDEAEVEINMGFILFHFRQDVPWSFVFKCPKCDQEVRIPRIAPQGPDT